MAFFRSYVAPFLILLVFLVALLAVNARIFLPSDMAAPAPIEKVSFVGTPQLAGIFPTNFQADS
ncbi:MAG TPA: hypothetical protein V6D28_07695 [Leptolyngbyaceae cyanobacterium]